MWTRCVAVDRLYMLYMYDSTMRVPMLTRRWTALAELLLRRDSLGHHDCGGGAVFAELDKTSGDSLRR